MKGAALLVVKGMVRAFFQRKRFLIAESHLPKKISIIYTTNIYTTYTTSKVKETIIHSKANDLRFQKERCNYLQALLIQKMSANVDYRFSLLILFLLQSFFR